MWWERPFRYGPCPTEMINVGFDYDDIEFEDRMVLELDYDDNGFGYDGPILL